VTVDRAFGEQDVSFFYDFMFQPGVAQQDVYVAVAQPIVEGVINGFNGAVIAYGQTGSGKTHTMLGPNGARELIGDAGAIQDRDLGVAPRALQGLVDFAVQSDGLVRLRASYLEIYQEHIIDLLAPLEGGTFVRERPQPSARMREQGQNLYLPDMTETPVTSVQGAMEVMRQGNVNRHVAETRMNRHSSRSHAIFIVSVVNEIEANRQKFAQLYLVDLAGSERMSKTGVQGKQFGEAVQINKSLLSLGQVIWSLAHKQKHVPYRDSKLTQVLRNCLGGNARTAILIAASPHRRNANETLGALRFGARASLVENEARENVAMNARELKRLLEQARADLNELRGHCRALQAEVSAIRTLEGLPQTSEEICRESWGGALLTREPSSGSSLQASTAKRLLVWGLLPSLVCPLSRAVMRDPVNASDGWTYERRHIEKHFAKPGRSLPLSPVTGQRMPSRHLVPCLVVKQLVRQHLPDLAPLGEPLSVLVVLPVWLVMRILSYLDGRSLGRSEVAWPSFFAASEASHSWARVIEHDFPNENESRATDQSARQRYAGIMASLGPERRKHFPPSKGLKLTR